METRRTCFGAVAVGHYFTPCDENGEAGLYLRIPECRDAQGRRVNAVHIALEEASAANGTLRGFADAAAVYYVPPVSASWECAVG